MNDRSKIGHLRPLEDSISIICFYDGVFRLRLETNLPRLDLIFMSYPEWAARRLN